ncbi:hypothetical protein ACA910_004894 [Epithemia clementina (nom. ined.)]
MSVRNLNRAHLADAAYAQEVVQDAMVMESSRMLDAYDIDDFAAQEVGIPDTSQMPLNAGAASQNGINAQMESMKDPARLFSILEEVLPRYEDAGPQTLSGAELQQKRELAESTWDLVRKWMRANPLPEQRQAAAYVRGTADATPLHLMCKLHHQPVDVIADIVEAAPEIVSWTDSHGWLPLHHACANGANPDVMKILIDTYPQGKVAQDNLRRTPLHFYATRSDNPAFMAENALMLTDSGAPELTDKGGMLPMHYACAYGTDTVVLQVLAEAYPESLTARENKGRTPMHLAMVNAYRDSSPHVVEFLLQHAEGKETVNTRDSDGSLPLHLLALALRGYGADDINKRNNVSRSLALYLDAEPFAAADFLNALQTLPDWLQDTAVVSQHVRNVLNEKIVQRLPTAVLMMDGYMLMAIIICFGMATANHIDMRYDPTVENNTQGQLSFLFIGASYFLFRELIQIASLVSLGSFSSWFSDFTNWLDVGVIFLVYYYSMLMTNDTWGLSNSSFRSGAAFTQGVLYVDVIVFLKSTYVDFAVFVNGVYYVVQRLLAFLIAVGVILLAFAQMFFFIFKNTDLCREIGYTVNDDNLNNLLNLGCRFPHCTFEDSLLKVYTMMMGEIGDEKRYSLGPTSLTAQILYVAYAFLVVILLSNVLIAIVTDSYEIIQNDRAAIVFWSNRLDFVAEMDAIVFGAQRRLCCCANKNNLAPGAPIHVQETASGGPDLYGHGDTDRGDGQSSNFMRYGWAQVMQLFDETLYEDMDWLEAWVYNCFRIFSVLFIIPFWFLMGIVTVGLLWPPQIRELLFVQKETGISRAEIERRKLEKLIGIQNDMKALKQEITREMENDRDEMMRMRAEVEAVQTEVLADLQQVKELLSSLLGE